LETDRKKKESTLCLSHTEEKKQLKHFCFSLSISFSHAEFSRVITKGCASEKKKEKTFFPSQTTQRKNGVKRLQTGARKRRSNFEHRKTTSRQVTSRHDNVDYGNDVPDDIKVDNVLGQENPQPDTGPGGSNSKSKSQKQDQIIIKRQTEIKKNNKVHLK
jgi:hypothetical protein